MTGTPRLATLAGIESAIWRELQASVTDKGHAWRTPVLATTGAEGADARTVVLREVHESERELLIYSDARAAKIGELAGDPRGMLVMWSAPLGWQLRCAIDVVAETSGLDVLSRWARVKLSPAAQDYLSPLPPGTRLGSTPPPPALESRGHFAVLRARLRSIDWLELHREGHRRARFDADGSRWLQP